jgi:2,4-didehydro-3-deoxy-L-rhamnonate hydrolase
MRLCRFEYEGKSFLGIYSEEAVLDLAAFFQSRNVSEIAEQLKGCDDLISLLPPDGSCWSVLCEWQSRLEEACRDSSAVGRYPISQVKMLPPIARPPKLLLLAGNYIEHVKEQGDVSAEREQTFPYVFSKPPSTTLMGNGGTFELPAISNTKIDYELELAVVIGRKCRDVQADRALEHVAGYTIVNDISDRGFRPNPTRQERPRDKFFDWLHGKWHDGSCPCGPCLTTADEIPNPQSLKMQLSIDGEMRQDASSSFQVFTIAEVIAFISTFVTLEPGDIISTGTPSGVGNATGRYLRSGNRIEASIEGIGTLLTFVK